ncbi:MAG: OmpA family protein [Bacteroidia bacterium]
MRKSYFLFLFLFAVSSTTLFLSSCSKKGSLSAAREAYDKKEYFIAGDNYRKVYSSSKKKEERIEASYKAADCYRLMNDNKNADLWYFKAVKLDPKNADAQLRLAQAKKKNQEFDKAIIEFKNYQKMGGDAVVNVEKEITGCENALKWKNLKTRYIVENVKGLNTRWQDFGAVYFKKDQLFFTSDREKGASNTVYGWTGNAHTDIYTVTFKKDKKNPNNITYQMPNLVDKKVLNGKINEGAICFDSRFTTMYMTRCNYDNGGKGKKCQLYISTLSGTEWSEPALIPFSLDSFSCGQPSISKDGQVLYFSSDMPGGLGGKDIWMTTYSKRSRSWGDPVNLGPTINTEDDEMFPFIHEDGTLYFSSNGHTGLGGLDIFYTNGSATDWSDPINMKSPINSGADDFSVILEKDKESGYFSSNREGGRGQDDIYRFYMNPLIFNLSGVVRNQKTKEVLRNAFVTITSSSDTGKIILKTDESGSYKLRLKSKTDYELFSAKQYFFDSKVFYQTTKGLEVSTDLVQDIDLIPMDLNSTFTLEGIYYDLDKADLRPASRLILDTLVMTLNKYPNVRIELGSHTDCRADSAYNINLSQRRADSAVAYIISKGIDSLRIVSRGYGENQLVNGCACEGPNEAIQGRKCSEEEHQLNRRTTVKFLDLNYTPPVKVDPAAPKTAPGTKPGQPALRPGQPRR